jgi:hypothetical protein
MGVLMPFPVPRKVPCRTGRRPRRMLAALPLPRHGDFSLIGLFNGAQDLARRSEETLRGEFAKRRY